MSSDLISQVQVLNITPSDILVVKVDDKFLSDRNKMNKIKKSLEPLTEDGIKIVMTSKDIDLEVISTKELLEIRKKNLKRCERGRYRAI